ncbi:MAG TPA: gluconate 2-dehydrogenase subunit 3 family protein [Candidatus Binatia bacterium]|nr:gluconate 2-dehydrogenase subunit 3 family protein [Candidatus Binatia bacterium]
MRKLKLPRYARIPADLLPPAIRPAALPPPAPAAPGVVLLLGRREFLKAMGVLAAAAMLPLTHVERAWAAARGRFFTRHERATLRALVDRVIPPDPPPGTDPGAADLGAADYIEGLLTALDRHRPLVFAGGPFSNRNPFPDNTDGTPSRHRPHDFFRRFLPLTRLQGLYWRAQLFGSAAVPDLAALDAELGGPLVGLRDVYRQGLALVDATARQRTGMDFVDLPPATQDTIFDAVDAAAPRDPRRGTTFIDVLIMHTLEGCFGAPEYGGNRRTRGWRMIGLEGDSQPLGYSIYSLATQSYHDRPDGQHPMAGPNPDEVAAPIPLSADGQRIQDNIATFSDAVSSC